MGRGQAYGREIDYGRSLRDAISNVVQQSALGNYQQALGDFRSRLGPWAGGERPEEERVSGIYRGMLTDPTKRGMSEVELTGLKGRQLGVLAGAQRSTQRDIARQTAASGLGSTGIGIRQAVESGRYYGTQKREATRDIELANEEMKRSDLWKAIGGTVDLQKMQDMRNLAAFEMEQQSYNQMLGGINTLLQSYGLQGDILQDTYGALGEKYKPGFWKSLAFNYLNNLLSGVAGAQSTNLSGR